MLLLNLYLSLSYLSDISSPLDHSYLADHLSRSSLSVVDFVYTMTYAPEPTQIIEGQCLDQRKLVNLLKNVYGTSDEGKNNFHVEVISILSFDDVSADKNHVRS